MRGCLADADGSGFGIGELLLTPTIFVLDVQTENYLFL